MTSRISRFAGPEAREALALQSASAVRAKADALYAAAEADTLDHWRLDSAAIPACADFVATVIRKRYPTLDVPFHARWRHFAFAGADLWTAIAERTAWADAHARARAEFDLAITSVLLDAGAGPAWRYNDPESGVVAGRSEGLALASLRLFEWGGFSADPNDPLRADATGLLRLDANALADAFQVDSRNPMTGLVGRARLLNLLGERCNDRPGLFGAEAPRPGGLYDALREQFPDDRIPATAILDILLEAIWTIWERRPILGGVSLGDCWPLPNFGFVPLHKLSQWLAYSLIEPLERAGAHVVEIDRLTGLAEYRNGGLFVDAGVLLPRDADALSKAYNVSDPLVVSWRSLTVALLDRIAPLVRERLGVSAEDFPLARVLEGGTWAAGRAIAREKRADGGPPFTIISDGTVF